MRWIIILSDPKLIWYVTNTVQILTRNVYVVQLLLLRPKRYGVEHKQNLSGEGDQYIYHSKGHSLNPSQRDWTRYQSWEPAKKA